MAKLWQGRTSGGIDERAEALNKSISFDKRLYKCDIKGSIAHVKMLSECKIISKDDEKILVNALDKLLDEIKNKKVEIDESYEDIHSFVEGILTVRLGSVAKKIHTARSRNDQVALDLRLYLKASCTSIAKDIGLLIKVILKKAKANIDVIMPGFTHLQHAQPILFSHYLLSYAEMFLRDKERFLNCVKSADVSPIGSCALAGTTFSTDRELEAKALGLSSVMRNSLDGVSDRDFALEFLFSCSLLIMHLSRMSEEIIIFNSSEYSYIRLDDKFTTGSSIMPQKKNPDMAELTRGKVGRVYGNLISLLVTMKSLPLAYNKDMQEDKESVFDSLDTINLILPVFTSMLDTMSVNKEKMRLSAELGYINATDVADYLTNKGMPFRDAYKLVGKIVEEASATSTPLSKIPLETYKKYSSLFDADIYECIDIASCVNRRKSYGGTATEQVKKQISNLEKLF